MKGWMKKAGALCLTAALATCTLTACDPASAWGTELELVSKPTMTEQSFDEETGLHTILVEGLAGNSTDKAFLNAHVVVEFYDEFGDPLNDLYSYTAIEGIDAGEIWHYYVLVESEIVPADFEVSVSAYRERVRG